MRCLCLLFLPNQSPDLITARRTHARTHYPRIPRRKILLQPYRLDQVKAFTVARTSRRKKGIVALSFPRICLSYQKMPPTLRRALQKRQMVHRCQLHRQVYRKRRWSQIPQLIPIPNCFLNKMNEPMLS